MDEKTLVEAITKLKESKQRNFKQRVDLIINLKQLDMKKPDHQVDLFLTLPDDPKRKVKVCALVGPELYDNAKASCDTVIRADKFPDYQKDKRLTVKLASSHDFFIAQATIMPKVASAFGRVLGVRGKMPNPKAGLIVPPNANLAPIVERLQKTVRLLAKKTPLVQTYVGSEDSDQKDLVENAKHVYTNLVHHLPQGKNNIKSIYIKYTMGKPIKVM